MDNGARWKLGNIRADIVKNEKVLEKAIADLHLSQRGPEIRVAVRTADPQLQTSLRQDLHQLVGNLDRAGFRAESLPHADLPAFTTVSRSSNTSAFDSPRDSSGSQQNFDTGSGEGRSGGRNQQQQQRRNHQPQPDMTWEDFQ